MGLCLQRRSDTVLSRIVHCLLSCIHRNRNLIKAWYTNPDKSEPNLQIGSLGQKSRQIFQTPTKVQGPDKRRFYKPETYLACLPCFQKFYRMVQKIDSGQICQTSSSPWYCYLDKDVSWSFSLPINQMNERLIPINRQLCS